MYPMRDYSAVSQNLRLLGSEDAIRLSLADWTWDKVVSFVRDIAEEVGDVTILIQDMLGSPGLEPYNILKELSSLGLVVKWETNYAYRLGGFGWELSLL